MSNEGALLLPALCYPCCRMVLYGQSRSSSQPSKAEAGSAEEENARLKVWIPLITAGYA